MRRPPAGLIAFSVFFIFGAVMSGASTIALLLPGSILESIWKLNPRARDAFSDMGSWSVALMGAVCLACAFAAIGVWRRTRWGHRLACGILTLNLVGDLANAIIRSDPRTLLALPIGGALIAYLLSRRVRAHFADSEDLKNV